MVNVMRVRLRNLTLRVAAVLLVCGQPVAATGRAARDGRAAQTMGGARLVETVDVRVGREATVSARKFKIRFVAVREDSRCPEGVQCVWAGNARVAVKLSGAGGRPVTIELNTMTEPREVTFANYTVKLTNLAPRPVAEGQPKPRDYVATFTVSKRS
ncbi:MAG: hypothetical protein QOG00_394 [Pyrinomonadaceae bacterium]|nr:hypothetical protein [Pyrinomonadaceae bacterium]